MPTSIINLPSFANFRVKVRMRLPRCRGQKKVPKGSSRYLLIPITFGGYPPLLEVPLLATLPGAKGGDRALTVTAVTAVGAPKLSSTERCVSKRVGRGCLKMLIDLHFIGYCVGWLCWLCWLIIDWLSFSTHELVKVLKIWSWYRPLRVIRRCS